MDENEIIGKNKTLAVFFNPDLESNILKIHSFAMIEKENEKDVYSNVISGEFAGFSEKDFNEMCFYGGDNPFIEEEYKQIFLYLNYKMNDLIMFSFDPYYIMSFAEEKGISYDMACLFLAKHCSSKSMSFDCKFKDLSFTEDICYSDCIEYNLIENKDIISNADILNMITVNNEDKLEEEKEEIKNEEKEENKSMAIPVDVLLNDMINNISKKIVGQNEAIVTLVSNILYNQILINEICSNYEIDAAELDSRKIGILLDGPTGTGKTAILKEISNKLNLPLIICNANSFSETGYVGPSITDILRKLYKMANKDVKLAERGIVVLDEIDKLASNSSMEGRDMKKGVQEELLGFISGGEYDFLLEDKFGSPSIHFDTSKLTFILSGAFTDLRDKKIKENEKNTSSIGFNTESNVTNNKTYTLNAQDYVDIGLQREFFGRIKVLTCTKEYDISDLKNILLNSTVSPLKNLEKTVITFGYSGITYTEDFLDRVCNQAIEMNTGARALQTIMSGIQNRLLLGLINQDFDLDKPIDLTPELLNEYNQSLVRTYKLK